MQRKLDKAIPKKSSNNAKKVEKRLRKTILKHADKHVTRKMSNAG